MKYSVDIKKPITIEDSEISKNNIIDLYIQDESGQNITKQCKIIAHLSKDAMLGLGKSLIRRATGNYERGNPMHLDPIIQNYIVQAYGIFLHPKSVATIIGDNSKEQRARYKQMQSYDKAVSYEFELECPERGTLEDFEKNDTNVACFQVFDLEGNNISNQIVYVNIWFVEDSLIGFGTELIRLAHNFEEGKEIHIVPKSEKSEAKQTMGVYLSPNSCEFVIKCKSFDPIDKILEEYTTNTPNF